MGEQRPVPAADGAAALRQTGAVPLRPADPRHIGPYAALALLGSGGMGRVCLARAADGGPGLFAVKVIRPEYAEDARFRRRFRREAEVHGRLGAPYAPRLCGTGFEDDLLWMATEYVPGLDLSTTVRGGGPLPPGTVWRLAADLGRALAGLAAGAIVHRDLKPSNVLLSARGAHVIDFGIAKAADASAVTGTGNRVGTPAYMSPEYLRTGECGPASDVFSLAGTLVHAATGRAPFGDGSGVDVLHRIAFEAPDPRLTAAVTAADPELGALLYACLAKEPAHRPTARDLVDAAARHTGPPGPPAWPGPLATRVAARQRAYDALSALPLEEALRLRAPVDRPRLTPAGVPGPAAAGPGTTGPAAAGPGTAGPAAADPGSAGPGPAGPGSAGPGWAGPGASGSGAPGPRSAPPAAVGSGTARSEDAGPGASGPGAAGPGHTGAEEAGPGTAGPQAGGPAAARPAAAGPGTAGPEATGPGAARHGEAGSGTAAPAARRPKHAGPAESAPGHTGAATAGPGTAEPATTGPATPGPEATGPGTALPRPTGDDGPGHAGPAKTGAPEAGGEAASAEGAAVVAAGGAGGAGGGPHPRLPGAGARDRVRRRRVPAAVAGLAVCAAAVVAVVVLRHDGNPAAAAPGTVTTATGAVPGRGTLPAASGGSHGTSPKGVSGQGAAATADGDAGRPESSGTATAPHTAGPTRSAGAATGHPAGSATPAATSAPASPAAPPGDTDCSYYAGYGRTRLGDSGRRVLQVQCLLAQHGYGLGGDGVSGDFGTGTESAVRAFQGAAGLPADGVVDHGTWAALRGTG
ncbi:protein kinase [Streptomyces sp. NPDC047000]|uniref:protein kinase domain-containing protein n=1 Tax=Streptomyces sp. NPDC047000 TaxID=3155474 RepID=UPI0033C2D62E